MLVEWTNQLIVIVVALPAGIGLMLAILGMSLGSMGLQPLPEAVWRGVGLVAATVTFLLIVFGIGFTFDPEEIGLQHVAFGGWGDDIRTQMLLGVDGIGLCFLVTTAGLFPLAMLSTRNRVGDSVRSWVFVCLMLETSLLGALSSANLLSFIFFWATSVVPVLVWMGRWGGAGRARAAGRLWTTEMMSLAGLLFVAFVLREASVDQLGAATFDVVKLGTANSLSLLDVSFSSSEQMMLFIVLAASLAIRIPLVPLHFWLPATHAAAPTGLSVLLATGFVQTAAIGMLRFALPLFPDAAREAGPVISIIGIVALVYASLIALVQKELKRLVAYTSVGYAGFAVFGISTLNVQGITGAVLQLLTHGLATAALFLLVGFLAIRRGTTEVSAFGGLAKPMPICTSFFSIMVFSLIGLPLLGGFVGDLFVLLGSLETRRELSGVALTAMIVAASYLLWVQRRIFFGPVDEPANRGLIDLDRVERGIMLAMTIPIVFIGVYPNPVLRRIEPAVLEILNQMEQRAAPIDSLDPDLQKKLGTPGRGVELVLIEPPTSDSPDRP